MQKRSFGSVEIIWIDEEQVRQAVDEYAAQLFATHPEVEQVVVFGSFAKGNYAPGSDVDIFILLSHSDQTVQERIGELLPREPFPVTADLFPYTRAELETRASSPVIAAVRESSWRYHR